MTMIESLSKTLVTEWFKQYQKHPRRTAVATIIGAAVTATLVAIIQIEENKAREKRELERRQSLTYKIQMDQLDETESNLRELLLFINNQRGKLKQTEDVIESLESERERLEPLVSADRQLVDAIFEVQEERSRSSAARERWIGFGLGVVASLFASLLWYIIFKLVEKRKSEAELKEAEDAA